MVYRGAALTENDHSHKLRMNVRSYWLQEPMEALDLFGEMRIAPMPMSIRARERDAATSRSSASSTPPRLCFVRSGFQGASMQQICAEAGMSPGALYRYFPSKEAIIEAICEADRAEDAELFASILSNPNVIDGVGRRGDGPYQARPRDARCAAVCRDLRRIHAQRGGRQDAASRTWSGCWTCSAAISAAPSSAARSIRPSISRRLLHTMMAMVHGMALNDLPAQGVPFDKLDNPGRAPRSTALLRPTNKIQRRLTTRFRKSNVMSRKIVPCVPDDGAARLGRAADDRDRAWRRRRGGSRPPRRRRRRPSAWSPPKPATSSRSCRSAAPSLPARRPMPAPTSTA